MKPDAAGYESRRQIPVCHPVFWRETASNEHVADQLHPFYSRYLKDGFADVAAHGWYFFFDECRLTQQVMTRRDIGHR